jgi:hypothetical protein
MSLRLKARYLGLSIAPYGMSQILAWRSQKLIMSIECQTGRVNLSKDFCAHYGAVVLHGPFQGMVYPSCTKARRNLIPKVIGSYEEELQDWIASIRGDRYASIINVGSADGYYSVGLALNNPRTRVVAFDTDPWARHATNALAAENSVRNLEVLSMCTPEWLTDNAVDNSLIFADCEGYEAILLDPAKAPVLKHCDMMVETHEQPAPGVKQQLVDRFTKTHLISAIACRERNPDDYPELALIPTDRRKEVISEGRHGPQTWLRFERIEDGVGQLSS